MSNQRAGKTHRAAAGDGMQEMKLRNFFRSCKDILEDNNQNESAFYFEQIMDEINSGRALPTDRRDIERLLGV